MNAQTSRYTANLDLRGANDAHVLAMGRVPARSKVLDLGTADGSLAQMLGRMGCRVTGIDIDPVAATAAKAVCERVIVADLDQLDLVDAVDGDRFDVILMLDVLEHLADPARVLRQASSLLEPDGWAVVSLPNIAHVSVRLSLLAGSFSYTDVGLLDRTHLRFFDLNGVHELLRSGGWAPLEMVRVTRHLGETEITVPNVDSDLLSSLESDPEALTYQYVLSIAPLGSGRLADPPVLPAAVAQSEFLAARARIAELEEEVRALRRHHLPELMDQLESIRQSSLERRGHLRHLLEAMAEDTERLRTSLSA